MTLLKPISNYPNYLASSDGHIIGSRYKRPLKTYPRNGYPAITLYNKEGKKTHNVHRLIAETFLLDFNEKSTVNHKNGDKNDNRLENLEWVTQSENIIHSWDNGLSKSTCTTVTELDVHQIFGLYYACPEITYREISNLLELPYGSVSAILGKRTWVRVSKIYSKERRLKSIN